MTPLGKEVFYGYCNENVGANVAKSSYPNQRILMTVVNHGTTGYSRWKNSTSPMKKKKKRGSADAIANTFHRSTSASRKKLSLNRSIESCVS